VFRHHAGFKAGIGIGGAALGGVGQFDVGRRTGGIRRRVGEGIRDAAAAGPFAFGRFCAKSLVTNKTSASGSTASALFGSTAATVEPTSLSMRCALNGGILALRSLVVIDRLPEMRMYGRTRITSRLPTRLTVDTRTTFRAAVDSPGGGRRSLLCRLALRSFTPNAPRSAPSTRSGTLAKVISPSREAKTAPPMRAAPPRPVRMVPLNHCTETRRRSITAASEPSTESGGSCPRSMIPVSRPWPPPRDVRWFNPPSPHIPSTFEPVPDPGPPSQGLIRALGTPQGCSGTKGQKTGRNHEQQWCEGLSMFSRPEGTADGFMDDRRPPQIAESPP